MKKYYWLWANPLTAYPDCFDNEKDLKEQAERYLIAHNKCGQVIQGETEKTGNEIHFNYRLVIE